MHIRLVGIDEKLVKAWKSVFEAVNVIHGSRLDCPVLYQSDF
jgi:hypothetical protein